MNWRCTTGHRLAAQPNWCILSFAKYARLEFSMRLSMKPMRLLSRTLLLVGFFAFTGPTLAQEKSTLPGGADTLTETHGDWTVSCRIATKEESARPACSMAQQQANNQRQRVISIELSPNKQGAAGFIVLPFGLAVTKPITVQVDESGKPTPFSFSTCLPTGCIVPVSFDANALKALQAGTALNVTASSSNGGETRLSISLRGLAGALNRILELVGS